MERVIIKTVPRSGATVYLKQYYQQQGWQTFDEPWRGKLDEAELLAESNRTASRIAVKTHIYQNIPSGLDPSPWSSIWHKITFVRRNLLEQTLSYALATDKVKTMHKGLVPNSQLYWKYFKPGTHEHVRWSVNTDTFKRCIAEMLKSYKQLLAIPRDEIVFYEECTFKQDNLKQKHKSKTIANRSELESIWWDQFSTTQPHLAKADLNS